MIWGRCALLGALMIVSAIVGVDTTMAAAREIDALRTVA